MPDVVRVKPTSIRSLWMHLLDIDAANRWTDKKREAVLGRKLRRSAEWPPDVFCLAAAALKQAGAYIWLVSEDLGKFHASARKAGKAWQKEWASNLPRGERTETASVI